MPETHQMSRRLKLRPVGRFQSKTCQKCPKQVGKSVSQTVQLSSAENALTCECGEYDESTGASYVDNHHCCRFGAVSRTAEGFLGPAEGLA